jgi:hydrogenase maturation protease
MTDLPAPGSTLVIGLGNPLMGDDGFGLAVLERLRARWRVPEAVTLVDGGTWGLQLLPGIEGAERLLLVDAIDVGESAGSPVRLERAELPRYFALKVSPHQVDLCDVLALAELRGALPDEVVAVGVQPGDVSLRLSLSPAVEAHVDRAVGAVLRELARWGSRCEPILPDAAADREASEAACTS